MASGETTVVTRPARRIAYTAVAGAAVLALLIGGGLLLTLDSSPPVSAPPLPSAVSLSKPPFTVEPVAGRLGDVVETGLPATPGSEWVLSFVPATWSETPDITIALSLGERVPDGEITEALTVSDDRLTDHATGFHPMQAPMQLEHGLIQPAFGYYVGRPARITAVFDGVTPVTAHLAPWSADPDVTIFWFDPAAGAVEQVSQVGAFDANGTRMPDGTIRVSYF